MTKQRGRTPRINIKKLTEAAYEYAKSADIPIVAEFAHQNDISRQYLYQLATKDEDLADAIKRISEQKEIILEKGALTGKLNSTMAIFSLKQLGWTDRADIVQVTDDKLDELLEKIRDESFKQ